MHRLDDKTAAHLARLVLGALHREYPSKVVHLLYGDGDVAPPRVLTPVFFGSFDWHSAVHGHWSLARLVRRFPKRTWADEVRAALAVSLRPERMVGELEYVQARPGFEMPYGMAWLLLLAAELTGELAGLRAILAPLEELAARRLGEWLARLPGPIRSGEHSQTAFAMGLALDYARAAADGNLAAIIEERARIFYGGDVAAPVAYEPSAYDFLSPSLAEADLMRRVLDGPDFARWLAAFLPSVDGFVPVSPADRTDGKLVHFDGLNLSRAWMLRGLGYGELAEVHAAAGLAGVSSEHYAGAHWLGSFAVYWLTYAEEGPDTSPRPS